MKTLSHNELVQIAAHWLYGTMRCGSVVTEMNASNGEIPDAIGWKGCVSMLVECKTSRSDFLADKKKPFRLDPKRGMGKLRFYLTPKGLLKPQDLEGSQWGLLETSGSKVRVILKSHFFMQRNIRAEISLMATCLQRVQLRIPVPLSSVVSWQQRWAGPIPVLEEPTEKFEYI